MAAWQKEELEKIAKADDLHIAPFRHDGVTYGTPTWIWSVAVGDTLYVRAYNGQKSRWYEAAVKQKAGRIIAGGMTKDVAFEPVEGPLNDRVDEAYRAKYSDSPYLKPMISVRPRRDHQDHATRDEQITTRRRRFMEIKRNGSRPSAKGPAEYFTGTVRIDPLFEAADPARARGASVTFEAGARTAWHTHPLGQTLIVTFGVGLVQRWDGPIEEIRPGDVVWFSPEEKHWHGASPTVAMTHIAIQEALNGKVVDWMEHISDEQYQRSKG